MTLSLVLSSQSYNLSFQIITCDYEQDNFGKTIELTLEIYATVKEVETDNLACVNYTKCGGTLSILYEGGKERNKWIIVCHWFANSQPPAKSNTRIKVCIVNVKKITSG